MPPSDAYYVVVRLLGGQRAAGGLRVESQLPTPWVFSAESLAHDARPHAPGCSELGDFFQEVIVGIKEEG